ncbi:hypothetical protein [Daejeonella sp. JGW-45]|uniref:hypothetical protein n=1 Tax=Daejeonella sp. JGW-45 TaxID=3034148 RepID=UPI0023EC8ADD|nr:hypothetical protein [Daejeonella sp. JGW-45]
MLRLVNHNSIALPQIIYLGAASVAAPGCTRVVLVAAPPVGYSLPIPAPVYHSGLPNSSS